MNTETKEQKDKKTPKESSQKKREWHILDASGKPMGRLASEVSQLVRGKNKIEFIRNQDVGDHVVVINVSNIVLTGNKKAEKRYYSHSKYLGNLKEKTIEQIGIKQAFTKSVFGMLPSNKLRREWMKRLHIYEGSDHPHKANIAGVKK